MRWLMDGWNSCNHTNHLFHEPWNCSNHALEVILTKYTFCSDRGGEGSSIERTHFVHVYLCFEPGAIHFLVRKRLRMAQGISWNNIYRLRGTHNAPSWLLGLNPSQILVLSTKKLQLPLWSCSVCILPVTWKMIFFSLPLSHFLLFSHLLSKTTIQSA